MTDNLVVDFPSRCAVSKKKAKVKKCNAAVSFSTSSQLHIVERIDGASEIWYSVQDYKAMNIAAKHAALMVNKQYRRSSSSRQHGRVAADASSSLSMDDRLTGIEHLISPSAIRAIKHRRAECSKAVLREQQRQVETGIYDPDSLAFASHGHSKHASKRARAIGLLQSGRPEQDVKLAKNIDIRGTSSPTGVCQ